jgi:hypothetical protein
LDTRIFVLRGSGQADLRIKSGKETDNGPEVLSEVLLSRSQGPCGPPTSRSRRPEAPEPLARKPERHRVRTVESVLMLNVFPPRVVTRVVYRTRRSANGPAYLKGMRAGYPPNPGVYLMPDGASSHGMAEVRPWAKANPGSQFATSTPALSIPGRVTSRTSRSSRCPGRRSRFRRKWGRRSMWRPTLGAPEAGQGIPRHRALRPTAAGDEVHPT